MTVTQPAPTAKKPVKPTPAAPVVSAPLQKMLDAKKSFQKSFLERGTEIELMLVSILAGENILFVGPPGTAKSEMCDAIAELLDKDCFSVLLGRYTTPEDIFGPPDLKKLESTGDYVRKIDGFLPTAEIAFLDEIFKSGAGILNTMLKILNERTYRNGDTVIKCPLRFAMAASNEFPSSESATELSALYDRFIIRRVVAPVKTKSALKELLFGDLKRGKVASLTGAELAEAQDQVQQITWSDDAEKALMEILIELQKQGFRVGDRRKRKAPRIVQAYAWLLGASEVTPDHLEVLQHVLWENHDDFKKVSEIILKKANPDQVAIVDAIVAAERITNETDFSNTNSLVKSAGELDAIVKQLEKFSAAGSAKAVEALRRVREAKSKIMKAAIGDHS